MSDWPVHPKSGPGEPVLQVGLTPPFFFPPEGLMLGEYPPTGLRPLMSL